MAVRFVGAKGFVLANGLAGLVSRLVLNGGLAVSFGPSLYGRVWMLV